MSSANDKSAAPVESPKKGGVAETFNGARERASQSSAEEAYKEMDRRSPGTDSQSRDSGTSQSRLPSDKSLGATQTADQPEGKDKGMTGMNADGSIKYDSNQRNDRMSSMSTTADAEGRFTTRQFDGRPDGMKSLVTNETKGESSATRTYDSNKSPNGLVGEQIVTNKDGTTSVARNFDPAKNSNGLQSERIKDTPGSMQTDRTFASDPGQSTSVKSESIVVDKASGAERKTYQLASGNSIQIDKSGPNAKPEIKSFDANGKPIGVDAPKNDGPRKPETGEAPKKPGAGDGPQKPDSAEPGDAKPGAAKSKEREQKIEQDLAKYREGLEKGNKLPPLKAGQGPYQAIQAGIKSGEIPPMSHKEILSEARHIRDRDKAAGHGSYKVGEQLERLNKPEMAGKVEAESKRLHQETQQLKPEQPKPEQPKPEQLKPEQPKPEQPKTEQPKTEQPKTEQPKTEQPKPEQLEQPKPEQPKPEQPEQAKPEQPEQPKPEQLEPRQPGDNPSEKKPGLQVENKGASKEFAEKIQKEVDKLPENVRKALEESGTKIVVGKSVVDVMPELKDQSPRGHLPGTGWENLDGLRDPSTNGVVIGETRVDDGKVVKNDRAEGVLKHETGHATDHALGEFSQTEGFDKAYQADVAKLTPGDKLNLHYLLTKEGGKSETFAEVFGALNGSSANASETKMMLEKFPNVAKAIQERLEKLPK